MFIDPVSSPHQPPLPNSCLDQFLDKSYYAAFLQQLELEEIKDEALYLLTYRGGRNWTVNLDDIAKALSIMQTQGNLHSPEALSILKFVIDKLDRNINIPQFVRTYMCRDAVARVVLQRFNEETGESYTNLTELSYKISDNIEEANKIFNSIRFCDPAMGSGLFLVTLLNEMIAAKSQLGILADKNGNPLFRYKVACDDEGLLIIDKKNFNPCKFLFADPESRRIQEALLREKQLMIENCLYGVEKESFSVSVSKLRLWVELLKHVCWDKQPIESFPFMEDNLRCGDSLVSRFSMQEDLKNLFKRLGYSVIDYKKRAEESKKAKIIEEKNAQSQLLAMIQKKLLLEITLDARNKEDLLRWKKELAMLQAPGLFEMDENEEKTFQSKLIEVQSMVEKYQQKIDDTKNNPVFKQAIEWRYEFPDMLNETGDFIGFDCMIGNPPDTQNMFVYESQEIYKHLHPHAFKRMGEEGDLFYELGIKLLKPGYFLSYLTSNSWMRSVSDTKMRQYALHEINPLLLIEFDRTAHIDNTLAGSGIILLQKSHNQYRMMTCHMNNDFDPSSMGLEDYIRKNAGLYMMDAEKTAVSPAFTILPDTEKRIRNTMEQTGTSLANWDIQMNIGIRTGCNDAFIIDGKMKDEFVLADYKNIDIIKPLLSGELIRRYEPEKSNQWLICIPWHFPLLYDKTIKSASERAEERFRLQYPVIYKHLIQFKEQLISRNPHEVGIMFEWYALQRFGMSNEWDDFTHPKIVWNREAAISSFCMDYNGCAIMDTTCFMTGQHLKYLLGVLNSKCCRFMLRNSPRLTNGDRQISIATLEALKIPIPNTKTESEMITLVNKRTSDLYCLDYENIDEKINQHVYDIYELDREGRDYIETNISD